MSAILDLKETTFLTAHKTDKIIRTSFWVEKSTK